MARASGHARGIPGAISVETLRIWSAVLGRCVLCGSTLLFIWAGAFLFFRGAIDAQAAWFGLTPHETALIHYCGMGLVKSLVIVLFLIPWIAIRWLLNREEQ
jgi:hypothetical protein